MKQVVRWRSLCVARIAFKLKHICDRPGQNQLSIMAIAKITHFHLTS
jgi:hypothetical protein